MTDDPFGGQGTPPTQAAMRADVCMEAREAPADETPVRYGQWWTTVPGMTTHLSGRPEDSVLMVSANPDGPWREGTPEEYERYAVQMWLASLF